jgi:hypothetical protein
MQNDNVKLKMNNFTFYIVILHFELLIFNY